MAYTDIYTAATDDTHILRKQVSVAIMKAATDIVNESKGTANHPDRLTWARKVMASNQGPVSEAEVMIWKVLENATIQAAPTTATDSDVQFVVNGLIDTFADK